MLIRIPETPGIPAVLREIAALCPRHSPTAATRLFSFPSSSCCYYCCCCTSSPTACEDARARDIYREHARGRTSASQMVTLTFAHIFLPRLPSLSDPLLRCCRLLGVERSTDRGSRYIGHPVRRPGRVSTMMIFRKWKCRRFNIKSDQNL